MFKILIQSRIDDVLRSEYDAERLAYLESLGICVLLFENRELLELPD